MEFKEKIKKLRTDNGLSQEALASQLLTSRSTIAKWESGIRIPTRQSLELISQFFNVPIEELLDENDIQKLDYMDEKSETTNNFQLEQKHKLKKIDIFKLAMKSILHTRVRMILSFIICFIGLLSFFVANAMTTEDAPSRLLNGLYEEHILSGKIRKKGGRNGYQLSYSSFSTIDEANKICDAHPDLEFFKINGNLGGLFRSGCQGIAEISQKTSQRQRLMYGEMPSDLNDFFVTKQFAEKLLEQLHEQWSGWDPSVTWWWEPPITLTESIDCLIGYTIILYDKVFTLRGIVEDSYLPDVYAYFNEGFLNSISDVYEKAHIEGYCTYLYFIMSGNFKTDYKFFKAYHGDMLYHETKSKYVIDTLMSDHFYTTMATEMGMADWFYGISAVLILFVILIYFSISVSLRKNQEKNSMNYSNYDFLKIYLLQIAIPFILLIPLVSVSGYFIIDAFNKVLLKKTFRLYGMFTIGALNIVWFLLLCVGIVAISTSLSMIKLLKKQPIKIKEAN